jgi:aerobic carbon-monoxide dehydrogenase small subunit
MKIEFVLNDSPVVIDVPSGRTVVRVLREDLGMVGTKECCGAGECGACTILVDGRSRLSCLMLAAQLNGRHVVTIEGFTRAGRPHPLQEAFVHHGAVQCGYCTPGMILAADDLLRQNPNPDRNQIRDALTGNICRCTGYQKITDAVIAAAETIKESERDA